MAENDKKFPPEKNLPAGYIPPEIWQWEKPSGGSFAAINRPIAGPTHEAELPKGKHPHQLYSMGTPNGVKVTILFEELLEAGFCEAEYDAFLIKIGDGAQFSSGFVEINPNSKIPAMVDYAPKAGNGKNTGPVQVFESGSILIYLAEKFGKFLPTELAARTKTLNWLMWQMGSAPFLGGGFGHFYAYAPMKIEYAINRYAMEVKRQMDVLDRHLKDHRYMIGDDYTIADMAIWPWYGRLANHGAYGEAGKFLSVDEYEHVQRWTKLLGARAAVKRGSLVNRTEGKGVIAERHEAGDFDKAKNHG